MCSKSLKRYGFVAIMDAIGTSSLDQPRCEEFREKFENLVERINEQKETQDDPKLSIIFQENKHSLNYYVINDSIIVSLSLNHDSDISDSAKIALSKRFNVTISNLFITCLKWGVALRGAFSIGEIVESNKIPLVIGEATNDAAKFFESFDFLGIAATPECTIQINSIKTAFSKIVDKEVDIKRHLSEFDYSFVERTVLLKCGHKENMLLLGWPLWYLSGTSWKSNKGLAGLKTDLKNCSPSIKGEIKKNTIEFFKFYESNILPLYEKHIGNLSIKN